MTDIAWTCLDLNSSLLATMPPVPGRGVPEPAGRLVEQPGPRPVHVVGRVRQTTVVGLPARRSVRARHRPLLERVPGPVPCRPRLVRRRRLRRTASASTRSARKTSPATCCTSATSRRPVTPTVTARSRPAGPAWSRPTSSPATPSNMASAGGIPNAVLVHPQNLNATQAADLQSAWVEARMSNMGIPAVLSGGITFETLQFSPKDMALVELAQLNESRIAVLLGVPPFLVGLPSGGDSMTYSNVQSTLRLPLAGRPPTESGHGHGCPVRLVATAGHDDRSEP